MLSLWLALHTTLPCLYQIVQNSSWFQHAHLQRQESGEMDYVTLVVYGYCFTYPYIFFFLTEKFCPFWVHSVGTVKSMISLCTVPPLSAIKHLQASAQNPFPHYPCNLYSRWHNQFECLSESPLAHYRRNPTAARSTEWRACSFYWMQCKWQVNKLVELRGWTRIIK